MSREIIRSITLHVWIMLLNHGSLSKGGVLDVFTEPDLGRALNAGLCHGRLELVRISEARRGAEVVEPMGDGDDILILGVAMDTCRPNAFLLSDGTQVVVRRL